MLQIDGVQFDMLVALDRHPPGIIAVHDDDRGVGRVV